MTDVTTVPPAVEPASAVSNFLAEAHKELDKIEAAIEAEAPVVEKFVGVAVADLKAIVAHAEADVIGKATTTWDALKALVAKAEAAV